MTGKLPSFFKELNLCLTVFVGRYNLNEFALFDFGVARLQIQLSEF